MNRTLFAAMIGSLCVAGTATLGRATTAADAAAPPVQHCPAGRTALPEAKPDPLQVYYSQSGASERTALTSALCTDGAIIGNGTVQLGVNCEGHLNSPYPADPLGIGYMGLRFVPTGNPSTEPGCQCEGWGVGDRLTSTAGYANRSVDGTVNLTLLNFAADATTAISTVQVGSTFRVTHAYRPSPVTANLYEVLVTITNISAADTEVLYRRVMDWDIAPTEFSEYVTIQNGNAANLFRTDTDGFNSGNPFSFASYQPGPVVDAGPADHGALFDFNFGVLAPNQSVTFRTYYGAAATEVDALAALAAVGAEAYSLGQPSSPGGPDLGIPNTFIFGFSGIGGTPVGCGNGTQEPGEECDDGNNTNGDGCDANCTLTRCGNGIVTAGEECDDGNTADGDCCSSTCVAAATGASCDLDGNLCTTDQCDASGHCQATGNTLTCADGNVCTDDVCDPLSGCSNPDNSAPCDDHDACTQTDICAGGTCTGTNAVVCPASNQCHDVGTCDSNTGLCSDPAKPDGTPCNDDDACTTGDACSSGSCAPSGQLSCDDGDGCTTDSCDSGSGCKHTDIVCDDTNPCTADSCNPINGTCTFAPTAGASCDDGLYCDGSDICDGSGACVHSGNPCPGTPCNTCQEAAHTCYDPAATPCDDHDAGTLRDVCNGTGICQGQTLTANYAVLRWPPLPAPEVKATIGWRTAVDGHVCTDSVTVRPHVRISGDAVGLKASGTALKFQRDDNVSDDLVTGGGSITGDVTNGGRRDTDGSATELDECAAAGARAGDRHLEVEALPATVHAGVINVPLGSTVSLPASGALGVGRVVIDASEIVIGRDGTLKLVGGTGTTQVIVRVQRQLKLRYRGKIQLSGLTPEQVIFVVDGPILLRQRSTVAGTLFGSDKIRLGWHAAVDGQIIGDTEIRLMQYVTVNRHPFIGW